VSFIFFGDYQGQFEPFRDKWNLADLCPEGSPFMAEMTKGLHIRLEKYRRGTDLGLYKWFFGMYDTEEDVRELVVESRRRYPAACDEMKDPLVLCVSHNHRMRINAKQNARLAPVGSTFLEWEGIYNEVTDTTRWELTGTTMQPQSMHIWASSDGEKLDGIFLMGCPRGSGKQLVVQGVVYCVMGISETEVELQMLPEYCHGKKDERVSLPREEMCTQTRLSHAMCYYSIQGRTIKDRHIVLLDCNHHFFGVRNLIVGLSRATHGDYLHIGDNASERVFLGDRKEPRVRHRRP
jgi:hypothetical protein